MSQAEDWERRRLEATVQAAALCAYVDGYLAPEEREKLCECIAMFAASESEARSLIRLARELPEWAGTPKSGFRGKQFAQLKAALRTAPEREQAFRLAVEVANAQGGIGVSETGFLVSLLDELEIDAEFAREVLDRARRQRRSERPSGR